MNFKRTFILLFIITLFWTQFASAKDLAWDNLSKETNSWLAKAEEFMANLDVYNRVMNYIQQEREAKDAVNLNPMETVILFIADLVLSLLSLGLAIFFIANLKIVAAKKYLWFLYVWNVARLVILLLSQVGWRVLDFLVISIRQDLGPVISNHLPLILIIFTVLIYIWLLARSFNLNFFGALGVFITSHLIYFVIVFIILGSIHTFAPLGLYLPARQSLNPRKLTRDYIMDSQKIAQGQSALFLIRIKAFHF